MAQEFYFTVRVRFKEEVGENKVVPLEISFPHEGIDDLVEECEIMDIKTEEDY